VIENEPKESMVDCIGVVETVLPTNIITRKDGRETEKRSLTIKDTSGKSVEVTLWGAFCNREGQRLQDALDNGQHPVLAVKGARTSDFSGRTIGTVSSSQLAVDPDIREAHRWAVL
jgi:replication factor A1